MDRNHRPKWRRILHDRQNPFPPFGCRIKGNPGGKRESLDEPGRKGEGCRRILWAADAAWAGDDIHDLKPVCLCNGSDVPGCGISSADGKSLGKVKALETACSIRFFTLKRIAYSISECIIKESFWKHKWRNQYAESKEGCDSDYDKDGSGDV